MSDTCLKNINLEKLPTLMAYINPNEDGVSALSHAIERLRRELPNVVTESCQSEELKNAIYAIGSTITELDNIHQELIDRIPSYPEPAYYW